MVLLLLTIREKIDLEIFETTCYRVVSTRQFAERGFDTLYELARSYPGAGRTLLLPTQARKAASKDFHNTRHQRVSKAANYQYSSRSNHRGEILNGPA
jgi:hypothetical protein